MTSGWHSNFGSMKSSEKSRSRHHHHTNHRVTTRKATWGLKTECQNSRFSPNPWGRPILKTFATHKIHQKTTANLESWAIIAKHPLQTCKKNPSVQSLAFPRNMHQSSADLGIRESKVLNGQPRRGYWMMEKGVCVFNHCEITGDFTTWVFRSSCDGL